MAFMARMLNSAAELDAYLAATYNPTDTVTFPDDAGSAIRLTSAGAVEIQEGIGAGWTNQDTWQISGLAADFECRWTTNSGTLTSGTEATWEALSSTRTWTITRTGAVGTSTVEGTLEIRRVSDNEVVATSTVTLDAIVSA